MSFKHASGLKLVLKVGNGMSPEDFDPLCSINTNRGISFNGQENEFEIPNCEDPEEIASVIRERRANSAAFTGAGICNTADVSDLFDWWKTGVTKNCQTVLDVPSADGGLIWEVGYKLSTFEITGERGGKVQFSGTWNSDGEITSAPNT